MHTIIGLGSAACNIAEKFENNTKYKVKLIDANIDGNNCFSLKEQNTPEEYEKTVPDLINFFSDVTDNIIFITTGSGKISGASLKILKYLKDKNINILYIRPDTDLLSSQGKLQDKLTFKVLQEYARSGLFKKIYLVSNLSLENILGDVSIIEYNDRLNNLIYETLNSIILLEEQKPIIDNSTQPKDVSRIITFSIYDLENDTEKNFYNFEYIDDKCYYFIFNENELKSNEKLFRIIKNKMREKTSENTKISYKIFNTKYEQNYCFVVNYTKIIQD